MFLKQNVVERNIIKKKELDKTISEFFLLNITSCACLPHSGLKIIFHWKAQLVIALRSGLKPVALIWMLFTSEKRDVSSGKGLQLEEISLDKSFM